MQDIEFFENVQKYREQGLDIVLMTIVESRGSTPRGMGAKMALLPNGKCIGTIGGGCVESKVKSAALEVLIENHTTQTITSYLNEKIGVEDGDICGGSVTVLIEHLPAISAST